MISGSNINQWNNADGDNTLRLNYPLNNTSVVVDVGAYKGDWSRKIFNRYGCHIFAYEPSTFGYNICKETLHSSIVLKKYGLFNKNCKIKISNNADASSILDSVDGEEIEIVDIKQEYAYWGSVDLIKINIEGAEYELLESIVENGLIRNFKNIQIQFHKFNFIKNPESRRSNLRCELQKTHHLTYDFDFIWENWEINN